MNPVKTPNSIAREQAQELYNKADRIVFIIYQSIRIGCVVYVSGREAYRYIDTHHMGISNDEVSMYLSDQTKRKNSRFKYEYAYNSSKGKWEHECDLYVYATTFEKLAVPYEFDFSAKVDLRKVRNVICSLNRVGEFDLLPINLQETIVIYDERLVGVYSGHTGVFRFSQVGWMCYRAYLKSRLEGVEFRNGYSDFGMTRWTGSGYETV